MNFSDMLQALKESDEALEADLEITESLMDKVDSIKYVLDKIHSQIDGIDVLLCELDDKKNRLKKNLKSLEKYVVDSMQSASSDMLPGNRWHVKLVRNPPRVVTTRPPTGDDFIANPEAIRMKVDYAWEK